MIGSFKEIPTLLELYKNPNFKELELIQLLCKNFYDVFVEKYNIVKDSNFLSKFFKLITQFIFRAYDKETLVDYSKLLKGEKCSNSILIRIFAYKDDCKMKIFDLLDKEEFLFNSGSEDCYINAIGELMDKKTKKYTVQLQFLKKKLFMIILFMSLIRLFI